MAMKCARQGAKVSIVARSLEKLEAAKKEIEAVSKHSVFIQSTDVTNYESVQSAVAAANSFHQRTIDKLICSAGISLPGYFIDQDLSYFRRSMDLNYFGSVHAIKAALPAMIKAKNQGQIVLVGSACSMLAFIGYSQYASSKYALRGLADSLRNELKLYDMSVSIFCPGSIDSPGFVEENKIKPDETKEIEGKSTLFHPDEAADALISGLRDGQFAITNEPILYILRILGNGIAPRMNSPLEVLLFPIAVIIQSGFVFFMDFVVTQAAKKNKSSKRSDENGSLEFASLQTPCENKSFHS